MVKIKRKFNLGVVKHTENFVVQQSGKKMTSRKDGGLSLLGGQTYPKFRDVIHEHS